MRWIPIAWLSWILVAVAILILSTLRKFPTKVRRLIKSISFKTAANDVVCTKGPTVQFGPWVVALDVCLSPGAPSLLSVGQRVMEAGVFFFWMSGKKPCLLIADLPCCYFLRFRTRFPCMHHALSI